MTATTVTQEYLLGVREGRSLLQSIRARGEAVTIDDMQRFADNCTDNLKRGFAREMADTFRGERDFWHNQIKRES